MKNGDIPHEFIPNELKEIGEEKHSVPKDFIPDEEKALGNDSLREDESVSEDNSFSEGDSVSDESVESYSSIFQYAQEVVTDSSYEASAAVEGFRGTSVLYEAEKSVLVVSDAESGLGIDYFSFDDCADIDSVMDWLHEGPEKHFPDAENSFHHDLDGEEAYDQIYKITEALNR